MEFYLFIYFYYIRFMSLCAIFDSYQISASLWMTVIHRNT